MSNIKKTPEEVMMKNYLDFQRQREQRRKKQDQPTGNLAMMYPELAGLIQSDEALSDARLQEIATQYRKVTSPSTSTQPTRRVDTNNYSENLLEDDDYFH
jgi:small-conductance mechanosensitive channel